MKRALTTIALLALLVVGHAAPARAVAGFGPILPTPSVAIPALPGGQSLNLISTAGLTYSSGWSTWTDRVAAYPFAVTGTGSNLGSTTIDGNATPNWIAQATKSGFSDASVTSATLFGSPAASFTIAIVTKYTGTTTGGAAPSPAYTLPTMFADADAYWGVGLYADSTDSTKARTVAYVDTSGYHTASAVGASGSISSPHYIIAQWASGVLSVQLDSGSPVTGTATGNLGSVAWQAAVGYSYLTYGNYQGPIGQIVAWPSGTVSVSAISANLHAVWGI